MVSGILSYSLNSFFIPLALPAQDDITRHRRLEDWQELISPSSSGWDCDSRVPAWSGFGEGCLPASQCLLAVSS